MASPLKKCFLGILLGYGIILSGLFYWHLFADLGEHQANPRYYSLFAQERGPILDRQGRPLAFSVPQGDKYVRQYATPSLALSIGYFHWRYGMTGLERLYHRELQEGRTLLTTLDLEIQKLAEEALGSQTGGVLVLQPKSGEILALVSSPSLDGNKIEENWAEYRADLRSPFLNRITQGLYPPGSLVKPLVYAAALEEGLAEPEQSWLDQGKLTVEGRTLRNFGERAWGPISTDQALALSSNVVFAQLAVALGGELLAYYQKFGLGSSYQFELGNQKGFLPGQIDSSLSAALLGLGQGDLLVTPLQMALALAAIANRGTLLGPYLVSELRGGLRMRQITRPRVLGRPISERSALIVRDAMVLAVQAGTAQALGGEDFYLAAKTGTAQVASGPDHSWFLGFAPSQNPLVAAVVLVEHGGAGSVAAAPLGAEIIGGALQILGAEKGNR